MQNFFLLCYWHQHSLNIYFVASSRQAWYHFDSASCGWGLVLESYHSWMSFLTSQNNSFFRLSNKRLYGILLCLEFCLILSTILIILNKWSTCCSLFLMLIVCLGIPYKPYISDDFIMYAYLYMSNFSNGYDSPLVLHISTFQ